MFKRFLLYILRYILNKKSGVFFTVTIKGTPELIYAKRGFKIIPTINSVIEFDDEVQYRVMNVTHKITSGHKIFVGLEKIEK